MDRGSWFTQSSLSIYGDDHVIDNKNQYNCHALMITLWRLYVLKHIVERSTHMCLLGHPFVRLVWLVTPPRHTSPFLPPDKGCFLHRLCHTMHMPSITRTPFIHIHHTLKGEHILRTSAMIYKYMWSNISLIYPHLVVSNTSWHGKQGIKHR
jgi:hypothetical protein